MNKYIKIVQILLVIIGLKVIFFSFVLLQLLAANNRDYQSNLYRIQVYNKKYNELHSIELSLERIKRINDNILHNSGDIEAIIWLEGAISVNMASIDESLTNFSRDLLSSHDIVEETAAMMVIYKKALGELTELAKSGNDTAMETLMADITSDSQTIDGRIRLMSHMCRELLEDTYYSVYERSTSSSLIVMVLILAMTTISGMSAALLLLVRAKS
ncbi:MAG: hypothetical protein LBC96_03680 [Lachnospiraceae bacterium]|jgi:hypothetical protein|nr:hypothetical protein [Lachnospiraceae bacterium]